MSDDRRKLYSKKGTGTVPKIKYAKNTIHSQEQDPNLLSNNLGRDSYVVNRTRHFGNSERSPGSSFHIMDHTLEEQNSLQQPIDSKGDSRRNSTETITKCDNITKYPDKKQIEDKLNQIRECLNITSSIVSNMKNSDDHHQYDQIEKEEIEKTYNDLKDSENKLSKMLSDIEEFENSDNQGDRLKSIENGIDTVQEQIMRLPKNQIEKKVEQTNHQLELLLEQENLLLTLQQKAENQLREARLAQQKLISHQNYDVDSSSENASSKKGNQDIRELEERWNALRLEPSTSNNLTENLQNQVEVLQHKVGQLRDTNDNRTHLIQMLDKRDVQLQNEHAELQGKLWELQNKKRQVDQLVSQLQTMNDESEEDDMGSQVRKIVVMKEQLSKLKDMLEVVKNSELNFNESDNEINEIVTTSKSHNLIQRNQLDDNPTRSNPSNEQKLKDKQVNKKTMNAQEKERLKLQGELQAKKRELEELMCKHKAASSNLNQDVQCEYKPDMATINNTFEAAAFYRMYPTTPKSGAYSSDEAEEEGDANEYSDENVNSDVASNPVPSAMIPIEVTTIDDYLKNQQQARQFLFCPERASETRASSRTADNNSGIQPISNTTGLPKQRIRSNSERDSQNKTQTQKQLELIRSVCDSMLEQQNLITKQPRRSLQNVRNNLTPSPLYSEPRREFSSSPNPMNALNVVNNAPSGSSNQTGGFDNIFNAANSLPPNFNLDPNSNYQNWIATNTLQTQAYMLNTLNQCCQMLWLQQKEIATLRSNVMMMQEKLSFEHQSNPLPPPPPLYSNGIPPKLNHQQQQQQVSSATSLPNLNHPMHVTTNLEYAAHHNNLHNARILENAAVLNNHSIHHQGGQPPLPSQIWNGPALNNQVAPGNRANNYWDNFRSYSRQNLLSTKSNEGLQNASSHQQPLSNDRLNNSIDGTAFVYPFSTSSGTTTQKRNTIFQQDTAVSSVENTPRRRLTENEPEQSISSDKSNENAMVPEVVTQSNVEEQQEIEKPPQIRNNRNEWTTSDEATSTTQKSKLFEELRENVYKEVASLISANQGRPHFLLQLFRDLQLISSDPLRRQTLQSIQSLVSNSLVTSNSATDSLRQVSHDESLENDALESQSQSYFILPSFGNHLNENNLDPDCPTYLSDVLTFLNLHSEEVLQQNLLDYLKELLIESTFSSVFTNSSNNPKDSIIHKHFACLVAGAFEQFKGKKVQEVRLDILQTIEELLRGEISLIRLMRDSISEANELSINDQPLSQTYPFNLQSELSSTTTDTLQQQQPIIQNGDLAEADQSRMDIEEEEEEGAIGGILCPLNETANDQGVEELVDTSNLDFTNVVEAELVEHGLDQVPTRLSSAHCRSKINTSRDRSNSSRSDTEQI
nr:uncharacterized protein LOC111424984 isoform X1 [Onthophagus taurus]